MSYFGRKSTINQDNIDAPARVSLNNDLYIAERVVLTGSGFEGNIIDGNFWQTGATPNSVISVASSELRLTSVDNAGGDGYSQVTTTRKARLLSTFRNKFSCHIKPIVPPIINRGFRFNWGVYDENIETGILYLIDSILPGGDLQVRIRLVSTASTTTISTFNGDYGPGGFLAVRDRYDEYNIIYGDNQVLFFVNDILLHAEQGDSTPITNTLMLPIRLRAVTSGNTPTTVHCRSAVVTRIGSKFSRSKYINLTSAGVYVLKTSMGTLQKVTINDAGGGSDTLVLHDGVSTGDPVIASIDLGQSNLSIILPYELDFNNGLTINLIVSGGNPNITIIYD